MQTLSGSAGQDSGRHRTRAWPADGDGIAAGNVFWRVFTRVFGANAVVFTVAALTLALSPATVSSPVSPRELAVLCVGLVVMLAVDATIVHAILRPLNGLSALMARVDLLDPGPRADERGSADLVTLTRSFNAMLDRLEGERSEAGARRLADQEEERGRIARELHDEIGQSLTAVLLGLRRIVDRAPSELRAELGDLQEVTRGALDDVREVARRLRPRVLDDLGLVSALADLVGDFSRRTGRDVELDLDMSLPSLEPVVELAVYRIAQESLTNTARHADQGGAALSLTTQQGRIVLTVRDNGDATMLSAGETSGVGIRGMQERAVLIGADFTIGPGVHGGTDVVLAVPLRVRAP